MPIVETEECDALFTAAVNWIPSSDPPERITLPAADFCYPLRFEGWQKRYFQYLNMNLVFFEFDSQRYVFVPGIEGSKTRTISGATVIRITWPQGQRPTPDWAAKAERVWGQGIRNGERISIGEIASMYDTRIISKELLPALHSLSFDSPNQFTNEIFQLLEILTTFEGLGSRALDPPTIYWGEQALVFLQQYGTIDSTKALQPVISAPTAHQCTAIIHHHTHHDGMMGGFDQQVVRATLSVAANAWRFDRDIVFEEEREGNPMT